MAKKTRRRLAGISRGVHVGRIDPDPIAGVVLSSVNIDRDDLLAVWIKGSAGIADALGILVTVTTKNGEAYLKCDRIKPPIETKDLIAAATSNRVLN